MADEELHIAGFEAKLGPYPAGQGAGEQGEAIWRQKNSSYSSFEFGPGDEIGLGSGARIAHCAAALRGIGAPSGFDPRALCSARYAAARRTVAVVGNVLPL